MKKPKNADKDISKTVDRPAPSAVERRFFVVLQLSFAVPVIFLWRTPPVPGRAVLVLGFAAAAMSVNEGMNRWKKGYWLLLLGVLAALELNAISKDRAEQNENFSRTLNTITGGDSYAFLSLLPLGRADSPGNVILPFLVQHGSNPLHGMKIEIFVGMIDNQGFPKFYHLPPRDMAVGERTQLIEYQLPVEAHKSIGFMVYYDALNGHWSQKISLRVVGGKWLEATVVMRESENGARTEPLYEYADPDFPKINGQTDWVDPGSD